MWQHIPKICFINKLCCFVHRISKMKVSFEKRVKRGKSTWHVHKVATGILKHFRRFSKEFQQFLSWTILASRIGANMYRLCNSSRFSNRVKCGRVLRTFTCLCILETPVRFHLAQRKKKSATKSELNHPILELD